MVVTEVLDNNNVRTYSDNGRRIRQLGTGCVYDEAIDPVWMGRQYEEIDEMIDIKGGGAE